MNYHNIIHDDMNNGEGLRVTLFVSGCSHQCYKCQNPSTWNHDSGIPFGQDEIEELFNELNKEYISGITLSGGDPLNISNVTTITDLCKVIKSEFPDKSIWCYTGYRYEEISELEIFDYIDVLCDGRYIDEMRDVNKPWVGSTNQRVIDVKKTMESNSVVLYDSCNNIN